MLLKAPRFAIVHFAAVHDRVIAPTHFRASPFLLADVADRCHLCSTTDLSGYRLTEYQLGRQREMRGVEERVVTAGGQILRSFVTIR